MTENKLIHKALKEGLDENEFQELRKSDTYQELTTKLERYQLLPTLFRFNREPYTLDDYPQFRTMYASTYAPDTIWMTGRQCGKTINLSRSEIMDCIQINGFKILYVAPLRQQTERYSIQYLTDAVSTCPYARMLQDTSVIDPDAGIVVKNVMHKSFTNNSGVELTYAQSASDRARGIFADRIDFDEVQDQLFDSIDVVSQSLTQSDWGLRRFTGTAKTVDNTIEALWQRSSQNEWAIRCTGCRHWNIPNVEGEVLKMIQVRGPSCIKCGKLLDVRSGRFIAKHPDRVKIFQGYHIPQIVVPAIVESPRRWGRLINKVTTASKTNTMQEILGISSDVGSRLITQEDIDKCSILPSIATLQGHRSRYAYVVGGVDWGVAEVTSFTVHTIVGVRSDGKFDVLWAKRFVGFDPDTVLQDIAKAHMLYRCQIICCDYGMGFDKNVMLKNRFGLEVAQIGYTSQKAIMVRNDTLGHLRWMVDKVSALDVLFWTIKYQGIRFPPKEEFDVYTQDLLSPFESVSEGSGIPVRKYLRNPSQPDDFCNALCFAVLGGLFLRGDTLLDLVPQDRMGVSSILPGALERDNIDPTEILKDL